MNTLTTNMQSIARLAGTSASTVSLVINGKHAGRVSAETSARVLRLVQRHGYRRCSAARGLRSGKTFIVGIALQGNLDENPVLGHFSMYEMVRYVAHRMREFGYRINLIQTDAARPLPEIARRLAAEEGDGLLLIDWSRDALDPILSALAGQSIPAVSIGTMAGADYSWSAMVVNERMK